MPTPVTTHSPVSTPAPGIEVVARASTEYRVKRLIMALLMIGWGAWSLYDGYVKYPRSNQEIAQLKRDIQNLPEDDPKRTEKEVKLRSIKEYTPTDIFLNQALGWTLPPVGVAMMIFAIYNSRGEYRLRENVLSVPGHPPVPLDAIESVDRARWDRKGIAWIHYALPNGKKGRLRLDDFIYARTPTDEIYKQIEIHTGIAQSEGEAAADAKA